VGLVVEKVALERVVLRVLQLFTVCIIPSLLHFHLYNIWGWTKGPLQAQFRRDSPTPPYQHQKELPCVTFVCFLIEPNVEQESLELYWERSFLTSLETLITLGICKDFVEIVTYKLTRVPFLKSILRTWFMGFLIALF
jgi:hypothetical protein